MASASEKEASWALMRDLLDAHREPPASGGGGTFWVEVVVLLGFAACFAWMKGAVRWEETRDTGAADSAMWWNGKDVALMGETRDAGVTDTAGWELGKRGMDSAGIWLNGITPSENEKHGGIGVGTEDRGGVGYGSSGDLKDEKEDRSVPFRHSQNGNEPAFQNKRMPATGRSVSGENEYHGPRGISYARCKEILEKQPDVTKNSAGTASKTLQINSSVAKKTSRKNPNTPQPQSNPDAHLHNKSKINDFPSNTNPENPATSHQNPNSPKPQPNSTADIANKNDNPPSAISRFDLSPIRTEWPVIASGLRIVPKKLAAGQAPPSRAPYSSGGLSLRLATSFSTGSAFGAGLFMEYSVRLGNRTVLRPYAGVQYLSGKEQEYQLPYYKPTRQDSAVRFPADSGHTRYILRNTSYAVVGLPVAITLRNWELSTGISARFRAGQSGTSQNVYEPSGSNFDPQKETPDFRRSGVPGSFGISWQAGADYRLSTHWRIGAQYQLRFAESASSTRFTLQPAHPSPGKQLISLHLRYYFRKK
ncbi:hypothetical protein [Chitinophaga caseinilytica]|uniref:hypothetical protein n=1 Tax=Chitinophaga caseinilytica TaxID=2267521 RepID=UPI003C2D2E3C